MVELRGLVGGRAPARGNARGDDLPFEVAPLELVGAPEEHAQHGGGQGFHLRGPPC